MSNENKQPKEYDAVLGGNNPLDLDSAVLGGIASVKQRIATGNREQKIAALDDATWLYDEIGGLDLVINALEDEDIEIQKAAYNLLIQNQAIAGLKAIIAKGNQEQKIEALWSIWTHEKYEDLSFYTIFLTVIERENVELQKLAHYFLKKDSEYGINNKGLQAAYRLFSEYKFFECLVTIEAHSNEVNSIAITDDGKTIVSCGSRDNTIKIWSLENNGIRRKLELLATLEGHSKEVNSVAITKDDRTLVSISEDKTIKIWDLETGNLLKTIEAGGSADYLVISSDGKYIIAGEIGFMIRIWDLNTGELLKSFPACYYYLTSLAISNNGEFVFFTGHDVSGIAIRNIKTDSWSDTINPYSCPVAIDKKDRFIVTDDGKLWDIKTGKLLQTLEGGLDDFDCIAIGNNDETVVSGSCPTFSGGCPAYVKMWDVKTGKLLRTLTAHSDVILSVAITNDGETIVSGSSDGTIQVWGIK